MRTFFTADTHFGHANIIKYCSRPFKDVEEMDRELVRRWNEVVSPDDIVWHMGDFGFGNQRHLRHIREQLNGEIYFTPGNHDNRGLAEELFPDTVREVRTIGITDGRGHRDELFLSHYAHRVWPRQHHGVYHLWGHSHGTLPPEPRSIDVGVDCWDYRPVTLYEIKARLDHLGLGQHRTFPDR